MSKEEKPKVKCGVIMPISEIDGCSPEHWAEVLSIIREAISSIGYECNLVSEADDAAIIHKTIIQNVYSSDIVVCDVSAKNANVMFELGMRLAFDKPTVIIKDESTGYSFDTSVIEHIPYPRSLRFSKINAFKERLAAKVKATYELSVKDGDKYSAFLKNFGQYKIAKLDEKEVSSDEFILKALEEVKFQIRELTSSQRIISSIPARPLSLEYEKHSKWERELTRIAEQFGIEFLKEQTADILVAMSKDGLSQLDALQFISNMIHKNEPKVKERRSKGGINKAYIDEGR